MVCLTDFEEYAKQHLSKATWDYYAAGADECCTRDDNLLAYKRYATRPWGKALPMHLMKDLTYSVPCLVLLFKCVGATVPSEFLFMAAFLKRGRMIGANAQD